MQLRRFLRVLRGRPLRLPIAVVLVGGFGSLMLLAVASVLGLGLFSATRNTYALLNDKADLVLSNVEVRVRHQLDPAAGVAAFLAGLIEKNQLDPEDGGRLTDTMRGALAGVPDVTGLAFIRPDLTGTHVTRVKGVLTASAVDMRNAKNVPPEIMTGAERSVPIWADPIWSPELKTTLLVLLQPVRRDGRTIGQVAVGVSLGDLSRFLSTLYVEQGINAFVLFDQTHVLAHPTLATMSLDFSGAGTGGVEIGPPLPRVEQLDDAPLAALWSQGQPVVGTLSRRVEGRRLTLAGDDHLFLLRRMAGYGRQDWQVGVAFRERDVSHELRRIDVTAAVGIGILLISVGLALTIGKRISRQVARLADAADHIRLLEFRDVAELPDSRLRELSRASAAFNSMVAGLRWFETYVPKALVLRLMRRRGAGMSLASEERPVTVMFTDIRGFSALAEHMEAADTAALLNRHFTQLATCIEDEGGTVDKFIGDAIMAFWGAPDEQDDHAARALRAAQAIAHAIHADNRTRAEEGLPPVRVRIGLHSGPAVVGNIGSMSRLNYTIVGDTVNVAARIEELASALQGDAEVIVLASGATAAAAAACGVPLACLGHRALRGRNGACEVWRLTLDAEVGAEGETVVHHGA